MTAAARLRPVGDRGALLELDDNESVHRLAERLRGRFQGQLIDVVAGHQTVLVTWRSPIAEDDLLCAAQDAFAEPAREIARVAITIPVVYDGPDLHHVARLSGISPEAVVAAHQAALYTVAFMGFAPGFAYLTGGDPALRVSRRERPRTRVPAGARALAGEYSAIYPISSPGGWQLIGMATARLFDPHRCPPALLTPGARVRFTAA